MKPNKHMTKQEIMAYAYWERGQLPPSDPLTYESEWQKLKKQIKWKDMLL